MIRVDFLKSGALLSAVTMLSTTNAFAQNLTNNDIDKLVDANGNYIQQALPYNENFLEPYMDPIWILKQCTCITLFIMVEQ
jgi:superoxide dismutase, Fe-Mn family